MLFDTFAVTGGKPKASNVGKVISVPEPTTALMAPAATPARAMARISYQGTARPYKRGPGGPTSVLCGTSGRAGLGVHRPEPPRVSRRARGHRAGAHAGGGRVLGLRARAGRIAPGLRQGLVGVLERGHEQLVVRERRHGRRCAVLRVLRGAVRPLQSAQHAA